jgi:hypothetical protein
MGVRGTDFMISTNGKNTSTVLFEGEIVFNKLEQTGALSPGKLEEIVDRGVRIFPGEFSVMEANRPIPTVPALLNIQQRESLEKNSELNSDRAPGNAGADQAKSVVPDGLSGQIVSNNTETLKSEVGQIMTQEAGRENQSSSSAVNPEGFIKGDLVKPANGSFVHIDSGVIIPPGSTAVLDSNTNTYLPNSDAGKVATDGTYIPPRNVEITSDGKILVAVTDSSGAVMVKEVPPPAPVVTSTSTTIGQLPSPRSLTVTGTITRTTTTRTTTTTTTSTTGALQPVSDIPLPLPGSYDPRFAPTGGIINVNDPTRQSTLVDTTIIVKPN